MQGAVFNEILGEEQEREGAMLSRIKSNKGKERSRTCDIWGKAHFR